MTIRPATVADVPAICELVNHYAEQGLMLHRSRESVYDCLREFHVGVQEGQVLGCAALDIFWADLAEIRSLAVAEAARGTGLGKSLVQACLDDARRLGISRVCAMTYEIDFFRRLGFGEVELKSLPEKLWRECLEWYNQGHRHETAMLIEVGHE
jgi:amino-acid N-acetyltransferase